MKMNLMIPVLLMITVLVGAGCTVDDVVTREASGHEDEQEQQNQAGTADYASPYVGQEERQIKALSKKDVKALETGSGVAFNGLAKPAELNGYPGPRHLLDMPSDELELTEEQRGKIEEVFEQMKKEATETGEQLLAEEQKLDEAFANREMSKETLRRIISESAERYAELRFIHLAAHLETIDILTDEQVATYNDLRGYASGDPCASVPDGHDPALWKKHNGCE